MKMKKKIKNPREGGTYAPISMKFRTWYFSMNLKQKKISFRGNLWPIFTCPKSWGTYIATVSNSFFQLSWNFFSVSFGPLGLRNRNKNFVCLSVVCRVFVKWNFKIYHQPSGHSLGPICMKFGTLSQFLEVKSRPHLNRIFVFYMSGVPKDIYYCSLQNYFFFNRAETFFLQVLDL